MKRRKLRLCDLPESILLHILSKLRKRKEVVRTSVLCTQWRYLWMSVPFSLDFSLNSGGRKRISRFVTNTTRELYYWRYCHNITTFKVHFSEYEKHHVKDLDLWVHFATRVASIQGFTLELSWASGYEFPQFAYKNTSWKNLFLGYFKVKPAVTVNWSSLVSLTMMGLNLTEGDMEKVLSGCPNLESLKIERCLELHRLVISSVKLKEVIITMHAYGDNGVFFDIFAPYVQELQLWGSSHEIRLRNVASLVTAGLYLEFNFGHQKDNLDKELICFKELLCGVTHVENLVLGGWCIQCISILELEGWQFPPSCLKFLNLTQAFQMDIPGICSFLQSSSFLETLVIGWHNRGQRNLLLRYTNEDEQSRRFETRNLNCTLANLKTIKIFNRLKTIKIFNRKRFDEFVLQLAKYLLGNAIVLESFIVGTRDGGCHDASCECVKMEKELLSFPSASPHASVVVSYG